MLGSKVISIGTVSRSSTIDSQSSEHGMLNLLMVGARVLVRVHARTIVRLRAVLADQTPSPSAVSLLMNFHWMEFGWPQSYDIFRSVTSTLHCFRKKLHVVNTSLRRGPLYPRIRHLLKSCAPLRISQIEFDSIRHHHLI
jgi:hypothetical protein